MNRGEPILRFSSWVRCHVRSCFSNLAMAAKRTLYVTGEAFSFNVAVQIRGGSKFRVSQSGRKSLATDAMHRLWSCSTILLSAASGWWRLYCTTTLFFGQRMSTTAQAAFVLSISESRLASAAAALHLPGKIMLTMQDCALEMQSSRWRC